jgi:ankyrin repeat protein
MRRWELVKQMISAGVNLNHYDVHGNTVLMAFVIHLQDGEDDKALAMILGLLILRGANIHWRNRQGETALHIAIRLGRKIATRVLLQSGASVHARTAEGKGVLAVGEKHYLEARDNQPLYVSIMACMALAIDYGAVAAPTVVQEWSTASNPGYCM